MNADIRTLDPDLPIIFDSLKYLAKEEAFNKKYYDAAYAMRVAAKVSRIMAGQTSDEGVKQVHIDRAEECDAWADYYEVQPVDFI